MDRLLDALNALFGLLIGAGRVGCAAAYLACVGLMFARSCSADAAPVPFPRPAPDPAAFVTSGKLAMDYRGSQWLAVFLPGGEYACWQEDGSAVYAGAWRADAGRLWVEERLRRLNEEPGPACRFDLPLAFPAPGVVGGEMTGGGRCTLRRAKP